MVVNFAFHYLLLKMQIPENFSAVHLIWEINSGILNNPYFNQRISYQIVELFSLNDIPCIINNVQSNHINILFLVSKNNEKINTQKTIELKKQIQNYTNSLYKQCTQISFKTLFQIQFIPTENVKSLFDELATQDFSNLFHLPNQNSKKSITIYKLYNS